MTKMFYVIKDRYTHFLDPVLHESDASAMRWFEAVMLKETDKNADHMSSYDLYVIGSYDDDKGMIMGNDPNLPEVIMRGKDVAYKYGLED